MPPPSLQWEDLYRRKPGEGFEDPEEVLALQQATQNMGDYKLKSASDYVVSEEQRVSTEKKRRQLLLMRKMVGTVTWWGSFLLTPTYSLSADL